MFKRVAFVFALLFAQIAMAQTSILSSSVDALSVVSATDTPVVRDMVATGTVETVGTSTVIEDKLNPPAEETALPQGIESSTKGGVATTTTSEVGAFGASNDSPYFITATVIETEESKIPQLNQSREGWFGLVYAGFEEFVRITLGWD